MTFVKLGALANKIVDDAETQFDLFSLGTPEEPRNPIEARFWQFCQENPDVYRLFDKFTRELISRGHQNYSADSVLHRIRWETSLQTSDEPFRLNNDFTPYFARRWMRDHADYQGFFRTRRLLAGAESAALKPEGVA
jgi:hypothetical protein